ncbi:MAG: hypothetical protein N2515_08350, partial [Deltaproteobacteria bacterium]|nr:hypothetical protein [Deltaproteobacteria bacterium]
ENASSTFRESKRPGDRSKSQSVSPSGGLKRIQTRTHLRLGKQSPKQSEGSEAFRGPALSDNREGFALKELKIQPINCLASLP